MAVPGGFPGTTGLIILNYIVHNIISEQKNLKNNRLQTTEYQTSTKKPNTIRLKVKNNRRISTYQRPTNALLTPYQRPTNAHPGAKPKKIVYNII